MGDVVYGSKSGDPGPVFSTGIESQVVENGVASLLKCREGWKGVMEGMLWGGGGEDIPYMTKTGLQGPVFLPIIASRRLENLWGWLNRLAAQVDQWQ